MTFLFLLVPCVAFAGVYKWVGTDGRVYYSDRPVDGAQRVIVQTGDATDVVDQPGDSEIAGETESAEPDLGPYDAFEVVSPEPNSTIRDDKGEIPVGLLLDPPLMPEHRLKIELDGQPVPGDVKGTHMLLNGVTLGSHRVRALILDEFEVPVALSADVDFHLRKPVPELDAP